MKLSPIKGEKEKSLTRKLLFSFVYIPSFCDGFDRGTNYALDWR